MSSQLTDAIISAFVAIKPYPAWLEIGDELLYKLIKEADIADYEPRLTNEEGDHGRFSHVKLKVRKYLIGWRVASEPEGSCAFLADAPPEAYVRFERGQPKRQYIASEDFDETETLRYERWKRNRASGQA